MPLTKSTIRDRARILLNELTDGFWVNSELESWIDDAALDISTQTYCYELNTSIALVTGTQFYSVAADNLKVLGVIYDHRGLKRATPWMQGVQTAVVSGPPDYFFEVISMLGIFPIPTTDQNGKLIDVYYASVTSDITKIKLKFQLSAVLYVVFMALLKERQYSKASSIYALYMSSLNLDRVEIVGENIIKPPAQDQYVLKIVNAAEGQR